MKHVSIVLLVALLLLPPAAQAEFREIDLTIFGMD